MMYDWKVNEDLRVERSLDFDAILTKVRQFAGKIAALGEFDGKRGQDVESCLLEITQNAITPDHSDQEDPIDLKAEVRPDWTSVSVSHGWSPHLPLRAEGKDWGLNLPRLAHLSDELSIEQLADTIRITLGFRR